jgi:hypothetical protein
VAIGAPNILTDGNPTRIYVKINLAAIPVTEEIIVRRSLPYACNTAFETETIAIKNTEVERIDK